MEEPNYTMTRQRDSVAVGVCPSCMTRCYINAGFFDVLEFIKGMTIEWSTVNHAWMRHTRCNTIMNIVRLPKDIEEPLTVDDLSRIYFRTQDTEGRWGNVNASQATDAQFGTWIASRLAITGEDSNASPWLPEERADVCDVLVQRKELVLLKKGVVLDDE